MPKKKCCIYRGLRSEVVNGRVTLYPPVGSGNDRAVIINIGEKWYIAAFFHPPSPMGLY
jgi:hypothetical protein